MSASVHPEDALLALVYGELGQEEAARVQAHVDDCQLCAATVRDYRAVRQATAALPREMHTDTGLESLLHYGAQAAARVRRRRVAMVAGTLLTALSAGGLVFFLKPEASQPSPAALAANAPQASPVGALARNDAPVAAAPREADKGFSAPFTEERAAKKAEVQKLPARAAPSSGAAERRARDEAARAEHEAVARADGEVPNSPPAAAAPAAPPAAVAQRALAVGGAEPRVQGVAGAGAKASLAAPAGPVRPTAAPSADAAASSSLAKAKAAPAQTAAAVEAGKDVSRAQDEARRAVLQKQLQGASKAEALPLLSELCALEVRRAQRADAVRACTQVVEGYPGTPEARAAQSALDGLPPP
jgi:hypothetical protein